MTDTTDIKALRESAESIMNLLENLAGYEPQDIDMDAVELRFEDENGFDTGCDISIVDTAQQSADIIRALLDRLEAERQRADDGVKAHRVHAARLIDERGQLRERAEKAEAELAALKGEQVPGAWRYRTTDLKGNRNQGWEFSEEDSLLGLYQPLFTHPQKPVVLPQLFTVRSGHPFNEGERTAMIPDDNGNWLSKFDVEHAIKMAGGIVKDGE